MALSDEAQKPGGSLTSNLLIPRQVSSHDDIAESKTIPMSVAKVEGKYPDLCRFNFSL